MSSFGVVGGTSQTHQWPTISYPSSTTAGWWRRAVLISANIAKLATRRPDILSGVCIQLCRREWRDCDCLTLC